MEPESPDVPEIDPQYPDISVSTFRQTPLNPETEIFFCIKQRHLNDIRTSWRKFKKAFTFRVNKTLKLDEMVRVSEMPEIDGLDPLLNEV